MKRERGAEKAASTKSGARKAADKIRRMINEQTTAAQASAETAGYITEPLSVIDEAREYLDAMVASFVYADGDPEGDNRDHRAAFNEQAANVAADLKLLRDMLEQNGVILLRSPKCHAGGGVQGDLRRDHETHRD